MRSSSARRALRALARARGIQTGYVGHDGRRRGASDEVLMSVLRALGTDLDHPEDAEERLRALEALRTRDPLSRVVVHREGEEASVTLSVADVIDPREVWISLCSEEGERSRVRLSDVRADSGVALEVDGIRVTSRRVRIPVAELGPGYHRLEVEGPGLEASALVVSAPGKAPEPERAWGVFIPLHALRTASDWGLGSFSDLGSLCDWTAQMGGRFVGTLPLDATFSGVPFADPSPYMPASRLAWNESYVDVDSIPEMGGCDAARALIGSFELGETLERLRCARLADPEAVAREKRRVLELLASFVWSGGSQRRDELVSFARRRPEALSFARFAALCEERARPFWDWPVRDDSSGSDRTGSDRICDTADLDPRVLVHLYAQWVADEQLASAGGRGAGLYLDIPAGVHPAGFDPWYEPGSFVSGVSGGAPPDAFFSAGQIWGFPPMHPHGARETEYRHFIAVLRHAMRHAAAVRVDHIMGLHRMYWVPEGATAGEGVYVRYRARELHAVLCLEAHRSGTTVVGEDLGTVPGSVRRAMERDGLARSFVFEFASRRRDPFPDPPELSLASLSTHDLPTFASYWKGLDIEDRAARGELDHSSAEEQRAERSDWRREVLEGLGDLGADEAQSLSESSTRKALVGCLGHLAASPARLVMADIEDLWLETEPQNRPGTGAEEANFLRRARLTLEEFRADTRSVEALEQLNTLRDDGGDR